MYDWTLLVGIFISLFFYEFTGFPPSGLIVPGYIALNLSNPSRIVFTFALALLTMELVKFFSRYLIIYGKRQFCLCIGMGMFLNLLLGQWLLQNTFIAIGYMIPGIMANAWINHGFVRPFLSLWMIILILALLMMLAGQSVF